MSTLAQLPTRQTPYAEALGSYLKTSRLVARFLRLLAVDIALEDSQRVLFADDKGANGLSRDRAIELAGVALLHYSLPSGQAASEEIRRWLEKRRVM